MFVDWLDGIWDRVAFGLELPGPFHVSGYELVTWNLLI